jgi:hypothetical protein
VKRLLVGLTVCLLASLLLMSLADGVGRKRVPSPVDVPRPGSSRVMGRRICLGSPPECKRILVLHPCRRSPMRFHA